MPTYLYSVRYSAYTRYAGTHQTVTIKYYNNKHKMADAAAPAAPAPAKKVAKAKKPAKPAAHPPFKAMILAAIPALKERGGSSRQAILKYIVANNKVDAKTAAVNVRLGLKRGVAKGTLKKACGSCKGAGKFRLRAAPKVTKTKKMETKQKKQILELDDRVKKDESSSWSTQYLLPYVLTMALIPLWEILGPHPLNITINTLLTIKTPFSMLQPPQVVNFI